MRIVKEADERREEIVNEAVRLFAEKGFRNTSVNDILAAVNIAKGTFYYYFKSKEELLDEAIEMYTRDLTAKLNGIGRESDLNAVEKFIKVIVEASCSDSLYKQRIVAAIHQEGNELLHLKSLVVSVLCLVPVLTDIVEEGNEQGLCRVQFPKTTVETLLIAAQLMFNDRFFTEEESSSVLRLQEFLTVVENMLNMEKGALAPLAVALAEAVE